ncbi:MAG: hypothetical protein CO001_01765 [Candidatus Portnoybacteria bacterium CG_4_8_14_3_um_filter_40_10]|uniref:Uncharacterized protein n=1 Tax=Candidatus Portnoybacteria bacterium CG_4_8_14_3_um_filter_40_10 TaxID=1974801 RepID=A0A2M7IIK8_9BACT|nr:MAG: hypothetical protein CO001_01765 [Candidatus Portnoybacteria bacterium CG_4_8_14_3_um_filter_40_10]
MGRYKEKDTTTILDRMLPPATCGFEIEDKKTGKVGKGAGFTKEEARDNAWKDLKYGEGSRGEETTKTSSPKEEKREESKNKVNSSSSDNFDYYENPRSYKIEGWGEKSKDDGMLGMILFILFVVVPVVFIVCIVIEQLDKGGLVYKGTAKHLEREVSWAPKLENKKENIRVAANLNKTLARWIETSILPRYRKTEIDRAMLFHYFDYNRRGSHITAKVGVPFRVDGCFTYWGNFLC